MGRFFFHRFLSSRLPWQFSAFALVGLAASLVHYGVLIGLVEGAGWQPVYAALCGYIAGGALSYNLSRKHVFGDARSHAAALWRFSIVAGVGFLLTGFFMLGFVNVLDFPYFPAQIVTTGLVMIWSFLAHKFWTFTVKSRP